MIRLILLAVALVCSQSALAICEPSRADENRDCNSCGNLEQNPKRGIDNTWNASFNRKGPRINNDMRMALRLRGFATVNLMHPPYSSPGVLFYRGVIRDPSFSITDSATYSEALVLQTQLNLRPRVSGRFQLRAEIRSLLASSTTSGTDPYVVSLFDQDGNLISQEKIERGTPTLDRASFGLNDLDADPRYQRSECIDQDPRYNGEGTDSGPSGAGHGGGGGRSGPPPRPRDPIIRCGTTHVDGGKGRRTCRRV